MTSPTIAKILAIGFGVSSAVLPGTALNAQTIAAATVPASSPIKNDTGKRICRTETPTGSRMSVRVCKTADEWDKLARGSFEFMERMRDGVRSPPCGGKLDCN